MTKKFWELIWAAVVFIIVAQIGLALLHPYVGLLKIIVVLIAIGFVVRVLYRLGKVRRTRRGE